MATTEETPPIRLLAIDDNVDSAALVARVARKCGYEVQVQSDDADIEATIRTWSPAVVTLDLCMPERDGINLMSVLEGAGFKGKVLVVSGQDEWFRKSALRLAAARGLNVAGDMAKPVAVAQLTDWLNRLREDAVA
jgi:CheY-like chemotaxis protein